MKTTTQQQIAAARQQLAQLREKLKRVPEAKADKSTSNVKSLRPEGIREVRHKIENMPLQAPRTLSGPALVSALKNLPTR